MMQLRRRLEHGDEASIEEADRRPSMGSSFENLIV
jgi:hypothetical protein